MKSMKYHLRRTLGSHLATYEELCTLLSEKEACLNSRPLCATQLPTIDLTNVKVNRLSRWQMHQQLQQFWQKWSKDYLQSLQQRQRCLRTAPNLQPGYLVLVREDNTSTFQWPTAVIHDTHPGNDGIVWVVTIRTSKGVFKRPITKLCPLHCISDN